MITRRTNSTSETLLTKENVEAILPLSENQQAFLWLRERTTDDPGVLTAEATLNGELDFHQFEAAWDLEIQSHEMARCSVRTPKGKQPLLVVWKHIESSLRQVDLSECDKDQHPSRLDELRTESRSNVQLDKPPVYDAMIVSMSSNLSILIWSFHHLVFDGWSTSVFIRNVVERYNANKGGQHYRAPQKPPLKDCLRLRNKTEDTNAARSYWKGRLAGFQGHRIFESSSTNSGQPVANEFIALQLNIDSSDRLNQFLRSENLTASCIAFASWAFIAERVYRQKDIVFGTTVSGRNVSLDGIQNAVGMFANVIPVRVDGNPTSTIRERLTEIRNQQFESQTFEHCTLTDMAEISQLKTGCALLETLLVVENFPHPPSSAAANEIRLLDYQSGTTSNFPITCYVVPGKKWTIKLEFNPHVISPSKANELLLQFENVLNGLANADPDVDVNSFRESLPSHDLNLAFSDLSQIRNDQEDISLHLENRTNDELKLIAIWEDVLRISPIGLNEDFFQLGGKSLTAVRLLSKVEDSFGVRFAPTVLIENPTIGQLANLISDGHAPKRDALIRFNQVEDGDPVACLHVGGGHATYFRFLAKHLSNLPVVGVHPKGLEGTMPRKTFSELAAFYIDTLDETFGEKRYHLIGYCMSAALCVEITRQLEQAGRTPKSLTIIDSAPKWNVQGPWERLVKVKNSKLKAITPFAKSKLKSALRPGWRRIKQLRYKIAGDSESMREFYRQRVALACKASYLRYQPKPVAVPIMLIRSTQFASLPERNFHLGWEQLTSNEFTIETIEATHEKILFDPSAQEIAKLFLARNVELGK